MSKLRIQQQIINVYICKYEIESNHLDFLFGSYEIDLVLYQLFVQDISKVKEGRGHQGLGEVGVGPGDVTGGCPRTSQVHGGRGTRGVCRCHHKFFYSV